MDFEALKELDKLDNGITTTLSRFHGQMGLFEQSLFGRLEPLLGCLDLKGGNIQKSVKNVRYINELRRELELAIRDTNYNTAVRDYLKSFNESSAVINSYFTTLMAQPIAGPELYQAITKEYINATVSELAGVIDSAFKPGITKILQTHVTTGAPITELRAALRKFVVEDQLLTRYSDAIADTALNQYTRQYTDAISSDLGLTHYYYRGTKIETTRSFCDERVGNYYTETQVLAWVKKEWRGKMKDTTELNIKINLGGWRCRHRLAPVTEAIYLKYNRTA